jgi:dihydrofolate reductase
MTAHIPHFFRVVTEYFCHQRVMWALLAHIRAVTGGDILGSRYQQDPAVRISMIMAMDRNRLIGRDNGLPWHISSDLQYFKRLTMGKPMLMGRVTFESIGKPLPGRTSIVVTGDANWQHPGVLTASSLQQGMQQAADAGAAEVMVIGGASICQQAMPLVERLYLTVIEHEFEGDTWLDSFDWQDWQVISTDPHDERPEGGYQFSYYVLDRTSRTTL